MPPSREAPRPEQQAQGPVASFHEESRKKVLTYREDKAWQDLSLSWLARAGEQRYTYNFSCLGRPIIQLPQDLVAFQEIVWAVRPDLIIETGIAHGGSLVASAMMLTLLDYCDAVAAGETLDPKRAKRRVLGVDIDIRAHNRATAPRPGRSPTAAGLRCLGAAAGDTLPDS